MTPEDREYLNNKFDAVYKIVGLIGLLLFLGVLLLLGIK